MHPVDQQHPQIHVKEEPISDDDQDDMLDDDEDEEIIYELTSEVSASKILFQIPRLSVLPSFRPPTNSVPTPLRWI